MKICWFGIYKREYPRNRILLDGLEQCDVEVVHCGVDAYERFRYIKLIRKLLELKGQYDVIYAAFPAPSVVPIAKLFSRKRVVVDAFYSMYDSIVVERKECSRFHPRALKALLLDWLSVVLADMVIADTEAHAEYWAGWSGVSKEKIKVVYIGSDVKYFHPMETATHDNFLVQYHGSYIPLQGVEVIIEAVKLLQDEDNIHFRFIGSGQLYKKVRQYASDNELERITFIERIPFEEVNRYLNEADVILGIFGLTPKTDRVIPNKVFEGVAVRKPVVTKDTAVVREGFSDEELLLIQNTPEALKNAILELKENSDRRQKLAQRGYEKFKERFTERQIAESLLNHIQGVLEI